MLQKQKIWILKDFNAILKTKKKKESQYEEKIRPVCAEEFDLNQEEEVLSSSKKALGDNGMLKITRTTKTLIAQNKKLIWMKIVSQTVRLVKLMKALMQSKIRQFGQTIVRTWQMNLGCSKLK